MIVYYVVRMTRHSTDAFVTRIFFASRDRRLRALRAASRGLDEVTDPAAIAPFVADDLRLHANVQAQIFLQQPDGSFASAGGNGSTSVLDPNDSRIVALRAEREPLETESFGPLGDVAFPMLARGRLRGIARENDAFASIALFRSHCRRFRTESEM